MSNFDFLGSFLGKKIDFKKDGHDMSCKEAYSMPFGTIVPKKSVYCVPNEHYKVRTGTYVQTAPMREDNFEEIFLNQKAVYVPYDSICRDYLALTSSNRTTLKDSAIPDALKINFNIKELLSWCASMYICNRFVLEICSVFEDWSVSQIHVMDSDSGDIYYWHDNGDETLIDPNGNEILKLAYYIFPFEDSDYVVDIESLVTSLYDFRTPSGSLWCFDCLRILDAFESNYFPLMEKLLQKFISSPATDYITWDTSDNWFHLLPYGSTDCPNVVIGLEKFIAYKFAVVSLFKSTYRLPVVSNLTVDVISDYVRAHFGLNSNYGSKVGNVMTYSPNCNEITSDDFLDILSTVNAGLFSTGFFSLLDSQDSSGYHCWWLYYYLFSLDCPLLDSDVFTTMQSSVVNGSIPTTTTSNLTANPIQELADLSALYKLRQDLLRTGVRRDKQMSVMFGVSDHDNSIIQPVIVCDSSKSSINIQSLINQAASEVAPLGARGARGNGSCSLDFELNTKDFGWLFFIDYYTCPVYYENFGIPREDVLAPSSWFNPRNNYLGLEGINRMYCSQFDFQYGHPLVSELKLVNDMSAIIGYSFRDAYLKQAVNKVHGFFTNVGMPIYDDGVYKNLADALSNNQRSNATFGGYLATILENQAVAFASHRSLYFTPYMLNGIFVNMFDGVLYGSPSADNFRCITNYEIYKVSPFPKMGLLKLD